MILKTCNEMNRKHKRTGKKNDELKCQKNPYTTEANLCPPPLSQRDKWGRFWFGEDEPTKDNIL
jgi:hypothetical protein